MRFESFLWLPHIVEKLLVAHGVAQDEAEEIFYNRPRFRFVEKGRVEGQDMYLALGRTDAGRYLIVYFIFKPKNMALIISARDMDASERRQYGRK